MKDRGMKKWMAYRSLPEQERYLAELRKRRMYVDKPLMSESRAEVIDQTLREYAGDPITVRFYCNGLIRESTGVITKIDSIFKAIEINDMKIVFANILDVFY